MTNALWRTNPDAGDPQRMNNGGDLFIAWEWDPLRKFFAQSPFECWSSEPSETLITMAPTAL